MRLLQLATGPDRLIDLHPKVTVVAGLDEDGRRLLADTVTGLTRGVAPSARGLLEAHGLLFDLTDEMLALLDVSADGLRPVVTAADLPTIQRDPHARDRIAAEREHGELEERWATASEEQRRRDAVRLAALGALERARRDASEAEAGTAERIGLIDELTSSLDQIDERRRLLQEQQATLGPQLDAIQARRVEVERATLDVRSRHQEAALLCSQLAAQLDGARLGLDPGAVADAEAAAAELARVTAEVEAERAAEAAASSDEGGPASGEPPVEQLARVQARIDELVKHLAAFGPTDIFEVSAALARLRLVDEGELVPSPEAHALADQIAELDEDLAATAGIGTTSGGLAEARDRLDNAHQALLEAEQAARNPELDRDLVDRLELAHAEVLDAIDKADSRFAGGRAQRRVDTARTAEQAVLDELGFASYSDYMMGYSLLNVDPAKEIALDVARAELAAAEDAWGRLQAETEAELARAERMERRRLLLEEARALLGHPVPSSTVTDELRSHRVPASLPPDLVETLERSLDHAGLAVEGEGLGREDLMLLAEAWLDEAAEAGAREQEVRAELVALEGERDAALAAVEAEAARLAAQEGPSAEEARVERLATAHAAAEAAEARRHVHVEADAVVVALTAELAGAAEDERLTATAAADAEASVAAAAEEEERLTSGLADAVTGLADLDTLEAEATRHLQSLSDHESASPEDLAREVAVAEAALVVAEEALATVTAEVDELARRRAEVAARITALGGHPDDDADGEPVEERSVAEEIEWYLLARLAAQRAVCLGGSVPLLLEDALGDLDEEQLGHVLGRLERMADAVQVIVVSDDALAASWALMAGPDRAAIIHPQPA